MKKIKKIIRKIKNNEEYKAKYLYIKYLKKINVEDNIILFESFSGDDFSGSPFYIFLEIYNNKEYDNIKKYICIKENYRKKLEKILDFHNTWENVFVVIRNSKEYCKLLLQAKYLVNNVTFPAYFIRKNEQIYLNTWHGTPFKGLGRNIKNNANSIGNVQRNFLYATHLLYSNQYTFDHIREDYMIGKYYQGKYILSGYPCNDIFFDKDFPKKIRNNLNIENKKIIVYMPTWRSASENSEKQYIYIMHTLYTFDQKLNDDTIVYVKLHHLTSKRIKFEKFKKILPFPDEYETYEFLTIADILITDYSSVMFDFANTGKKIILYTYDKEEYLNSRSVYFDIDKLPFLLTDNINMICNEIINTSINVDYSKFVKKFCEYDNPKSSKNICDYIFKDIINNNMKIIDGKKYHNNRPNILIFAGELRKNGITTALKSLLNNVNLEEKNYILTFYKTKVEANKLTINDFSKDIDYISIMGKKNITLFEAIIQYIYFNLNISTKYISKVMDSIFEREVQRCFPYIKFENVIHYTGYERHAIHLLGNIDAKKVIYTHNDLISENKTKKNIHINSLKYAYKTYDKIAIIRETMRNEIIKNSKKVDTKKIVLAHNFNDIETIKESSVKEIKFDSDTYCNYELDFLNKILEDKKYRKFINIARYSKEKGMERLIEAFEMYREEDKNAYLIIIGGYGNNFDSIKNIIKNKENIIIIRSLSNPYPILNKCDLFILASFYEGLPMTIMEALILDKPVISTNITGPKEFLEKGYGYLVDNSKEGILEGMLKFKNGNLKKLKKFDAYKFNKIALKEYYEIIK